MGPLGLLTQHAQRVHIHYHYGIRYQKTILIIRFWGPNSIVVVYMDSLGRVCKAYG